jgi:hypothetical protein
MCEVPPPTDIGVVRPIDLNFNKLPVWWRSTKGIPYVRWIPTGMPKLGKYTDILKSVVFLYENTEHAKQGMRFGGTGFLISVPSEKYGIKFRHAHCVTNRHVSVYNPKGPPSPVIRINCRSGAPDSIELDPSEWISRPSWHDIAISPPLELTNEHDALPLDIPTWWMTEEQEAAAEIGPADDVFMIGRFIDYDGIETNTPAVRFGHISIMDAKIKQESTGYFGRSIIIDVHSRTGFSGSPVFIFRTTGSHFMENVEPGRLIMGGGHFMGLLGIHWGQFPELWELKNGEMTETQDASLITEGKYVKGWSGMSCVIASANIRDLALHDPGLRR